MTVIEGRSFGYIVKDISKAKKELIAELEMLRGHVVGLEQLVYESRGEEAALRESEEKYRDLYAESPVAYFSVSPDAEILRVNKQTVQLVGYTRDELVGRPIFDLYTDMPNGKAKVREVFQRVKAGKEVHEAELEMRRADGRKVCINLSVRPVMDINGRFVASRSTAIDVTKRKQAEEALQKSQASLAKAQRIAHMGNWERNVDDTGRYWSDEMFRIFGLEPRQVALTRKEFYNLIHPDDRKFVYEALYENKPCDIEYRIVWVDGSIRVVHARAEVTFDEDGKSLKIHGILQDITERKRAEAQLKTAEEKVWEAEVLREVDRLRSELMSNVSHELRTPLASIKGFASTLLQPDVTWTEEEQRDFFRTIDQEADRLSRIINDLLDISRLEAGAMKLKKHNYRIAEIIGSISGRLDRLAERHKLEKKVSPELPPVLVDEMRIGQVLANLVENAVKFSPEGSPITIGAELVGNLIEVSVADRGRGIPAELIDKVFDRFYQTESVVTGRKTGTGLGLSICRGIIGAHGGRMWVESRVGEGSKFSFILPVSEQE